MPRIAGELAVVGIMRSCDISQMRMLLLLCMERRRRRSVTRKTRHRLGERCAAVERHEFLTRTVAVQFEDAANSGSIEFGFDVLGKKRRGIPCAKGIVE